MSFSFSFGGDDIDEDEQIGTTAAAGAHPTGDAAGAAAAAAAAPASSAFPVAGKPLLPPTHLDLASMLERLPSTISYGLLDVVLDSGVTIQLPRRELWDVRVQLMAEDGDKGETEAGLGSHDVKTGVYEGGFKSWESSVDLVKVLAQSKSFLDAADATPCVIEVSNARETKLSCELDIRANGIDTGSLDVAQRFHHWLFSNGLLRRSHLSKVARLCPSFWLTTTRPSWSL